MAQCVTEREQSCRSLIIESAPIAGSGAQCPSLTVRRAGEGLRGRRVPDQEGGHGVDDRGGDVVAGVRHDPELAGLAALNTEENIVFKFTALS